MLFLLITIFIYKRRNNHHRQFQSRFNWELLPNKANCYRLDATHLWARLKVPYRSRLYARLRRPIFAPARMIPILRKIILCHNDESNKAEQMIALSRRHISKQ